MNFRITAEDRDLIVTALSVLADEYRTLSSQSTSRYLANGFEQDYNRIETIKRDASMLKEQLDAATMNHDATALWNMGRRIDAIKLVRTNTSLGLKDAKEYCENLVGDKLCSLDPSQGEQRY
jgi:hypothetical protein